MPKFSSIENLFNEVNQSIGPYEETNDDQRVVVDRTRGIDLKYEIVDNIPQIIEENDLRKTLGTFTLNNRDYWEGINYNQSTFQPYLTDDRETVKMNFLSAEGIVFNPQYFNSTIYQYTIDALPFVLDANNDNEIINVDRYWDKKINSNEYYLATEGKINYYLYPRASGRGRDYNTNNLIDIYANRNRLTGYAGQSGVNNFTAYANAGDNSGFYLFKLNWGDGSPLEYTDEPKLLEGSTLLEHFYEEPGFYTITGTVYVSYNNKQINAYEQFETNILLNPSKNYEFSLYNYDNFATIGGTSLNSTLIKSLLNTIGINPIRGEDGDFDSTNASSDLIEKINLLDKLEIFNFLNKSNDEFLNKFQDLLEPYYLSVDEYILEEDQDEEDQDEDNQDEDNQEELTTYTLSLSVDGHFANMYNPLGAISVDGEDALFVPREINFVQGTVVNLSTVTIGEDDNAEVIFDGWLGDTYALSSDESPTTITMNNDYNISAKFEWLYTDIPTLEQPEHIPIDLDNMWFGSAGDTRPTAPNSLQTVNVVNLNEPWNFNVRYIHDDNNPPDPFTMPWNWAAYVVWFSETDEEWKDIMLGYAEYVDGVSDNLTPGTRTITGGGVRDGNETPTNNWEWALDQVKNSTQPTEDIFYFIEVNDPATSQEIRSTLGRIEGLFEENTNDTDDNNDDTDETNDDTNNTPSQINGTLTYSGEAGGTNSNFSVVDFPNEYENLLSSGATVYITNNNGNVNSYIIDTTTEGITGNTILRLASFAAGFTLFTTEYDFYVNNN